MGVAADRQEEGDEPSSMYDDFPGYHWDWPVYRDDGADGQQFSSKPRLVRPKKLVVFGQEAGTWHIQELAPGAPDIPFVVISFTRAHFHVDRNPKSGTT